MTYAFLLSSAALLLSFATAIATFRALKQARAAIAAAVPGMVGDAMTAKLEQAEAIIERGEEMAAALRTAQARAAATIRHTRPKEPVDDQDDDDGPMGEIMSLLNAAGISPDQALELVKGKLGGGAAPAPGAANTFLL